MAIREVHSLLSQDVGMQGMICLVSGLQGQAREVESVSEMPHICTGPPFPSGLHWRSMMDDP